MLFSLHTLGNVGGPILASGGHSYAVIGVCTSVLLLLYLFQTREQMFEIAERIQRGATRQLTAADFAIMVSNVPPTWSSDRLRAFFERFGEVVHVGVSLNYRKLILEINQTQMLRNKHTDNLLHLASRMEAARTATKRAEQLQANLRAREAKEMACEVSRASTAEMCRAFSSASVADPYPSVQAPTTSAPPSPASPPSAVLPPTVTTRREMSSLAPDEFDDAQHAEASPGDEVSPEATVDAAEQEDGVARKRTVKILTPAAASPLDPSSGGPQTKSPGEASAPGSVPALRLKSSSTPQQAGTPLRLLHQRGTAAMATMLTPRALTAFVESLSMERQRLMGALREARAAQKSLVHARENARNSHARLVANDQKIKSLMRQRYQCTGYAFVTFNLASSAAGALNALQRNHDRKGGTERTFASLYGGTLRAVPAPEPHDVQWENLQYSDWERGLRSLCSALIVLFLCGVGTLTLVAANVLNPIALSESDAGQDMPDVVRHVFRPLGVWLAQLVLVIAGHLVVIISTIVLANTLERHHTHGEKERAIMMKVSFFQVINNVFTVTYLAISPTPLNPEAGKFWFIWFSRGWYYSGAGLIINTLIADTFVIGILVDGVRPPDLVSKYDAYATMWTSVLLSSLLPSTTLRHSLSHIRCQPQIHSGAIGQDPGTNERALFDPSRHYTLDAHAASHQVHCPWPHVLVCDACALHPPRPLLLGRTVG